MQRNLPINFSKLFYAKVLDYCSIYFFLFPEIILDESATTLLFKNPHTIEK